MYISVYSACFCDITIDFLPNSTINIERCVGYIKEKLDSFLIENKGQRFNTDKLFEFRIEERFRAYYVRLGYAHRLERQSPDHAPPISPPKLTFREYLPVKKVTGYENITEMLQKVDDLVRRKGKKCFVPYYQFKNM